MSRVDQAPEGMARLLVLEPGGRISDLPRSELKTLFKEGDLVIANDAATLPASLFGVHEKSGQKIEIRLAGWLKLHDPRRFLALAFGAGDHRIITEERAPPPPLEAGQILRLGPLEAVIERMLDHPRLLVIHFAGSPAAIFAGLALHGRPIQYAHQPELLALGDLWTRVANDPIAFEPPSAGFALDWGLLAAWRRRNIHFATLAHAAGISSTGDPDLDRWLPFDEPFVIPAATATAVGRARAKNGRIIAIGTTVVRALEAAASTGGLIRSGDGVARGRIGPQSRLRVVDMIVTGLHGPGESHFELLRAFVDDRTLYHMARTADALGYGAHEFGDSMLIGRELSAGP